MFALSPIQSIEMFRLAFLPVLESKLAWARFVVKDGVNLRAWFGSLRYSEDLDVDILQGEAFELRDKVEPLLRRSAPADSPHARGLPETADSLYLEREELRQPL